MIYGITSDRELICLPPEEMIDACVLRALVCGTQMTFGDLRRLASEDIHDLVAEAKQQAAQEDDEAEDAEDGHEPEAMDALPDWEDDVEVFGDEDQESIVETLMESPGAQQLMADMPEFEELGSEDASPPNGAFRLIPADQEQAFLQAMHRHGDAVIRNDTAAELTMTDEESSVSDLFALVGQLRKQAASLGQ